MDCCLSKSPSNVFIHISDYRNPTLCSNSGLLAAIFTHIRFQRTASEVAQIFQSVPPQYLPPFRDASSAPCCSFPLTIKTMLQAVETSIRFRWINWESYDVSKAEFFQHVHNGDMNWILENQFIAFAGPSSDGADEDGFDVLTPNHYINIFPHFGVSDVVRLNIANYDGAEFVSAGIRHHDFFFEDGSCPSVSIVNSFLSAVDSAQGAVAVHCKAGLGRSVTLIGAHVMRTYKVSAEIFIAWARLARPGSVIGPQQHFLAEIQPYLWNSKPAKSSSRKLKALGSDSYIGKNGDEGQASRLLIQKRQRLL
jgi:cell division cycle 14